MGKVGLRLVLFALGVIVMLMTTPEPSYDKMNLGTYIGMYYCILGITLGFIEIGVDYLVKLLDR